MRKRIDGQEYQSLDEFEDDFNLIINNCLKYNAKDTYFYRAGVRMRDHGGVILRRTRRDTERIGFEFASGMHLSDPPKLELPPSFTWNDGKNLVHFYCLKVKVAVLLIFVTNCLFQLTEC